MVVRLRQLPLLIQEEVFEHLDFGTLFQLSYSSSDLYFQKSIGSHLARTYKLHLSFEHNSCPTTLNEARIAVSQKKNGRKTSVYPFFQISLALKRAASKLPDVNMCISKTQMVGKIDKSTIELNTTDYPNALEKMLQHFQTMGFRKLGVTIVANNDKKYHLLQDPMMLLKKFDFQFSNVSMTANFDAHPNKVTLSELTKEAIKYFMPKARKFELTTDVSQLSIDVEDMKHLRKLDVLGAKFFTVENALSMTQCKQLRIHENVLTSDEINRLLKAWKKEKTIFKVVAFTFCEPNLNIDAVMSGLGAKLVEYPRIEGDIEYNLTMDDGSIWNIIFIGRDTVRMEITPSRKIWK